MIKSIPREAIVDMLLNSLVGERYVRGPLLLELIDELGSREDMRLAADVARDVLARLEDKTLGEAEFARCVDEIRGLVEAQSSAA